MKEFEFLKTRPYFKRMNEEGNYVNYTFINSSLEFGIIRIWHKPGHEVGWIYYTTNGHEELKWYNSSIEKLKKECLWFYEIVREAQASLEKRDRIRNLFTKG